MTGSPVTATGYKEVPDKVSAVKLERKEVVTRVTLVFSVYERTFFYTIGNYSVMFHNIKNAPRRSALRRKRSMSLKRPAAGGESRKRDSLLTGED